MTPCIAEVVSNQSLLDLCTDPREIYIRLIEEEEKATGLPSARPRDRDADQVLQTEGDARALYIRHLQALRALTDLLLKSLYVAVGQMPYTLRYLVREAYLSLRVSTCPLIG
jgi:Ras GTPase-activating-like protein IQGAP2/3